MKDACIHMAIHEKVPGKFCDEHKPIEVSKVELIEAVEEDGIIVMQLRAYFIAPDKDGH